MKIKLYYFILICVLLCLLKGHLFQSPMHSVYSTLAAVSAPGPEELSCYTECNQGNLMFSITGSGGDRVVEKVHNVCVSEWVGKRKKSSEQQNSLLHMRSKKNGAYVHISQGYSQCRRRKNLKWKCIQLLDSMSW